MGNISGGSDDDSSIDYFIIKYLSHPRKHEIAVKTVNRDH